jgi:hypothetical protein
LARQVGQIGKSPAPEGAGLADRLAQIEAELARLGGQVDELAHRAASHDELKQGVAQMKTVLRFRHDCCVAGWRQAADPDAWRTSSTASRGEREDGAFGTP